MKLTTVTALEVRKVVAQRAFVWTSVVLFAATKGLAWLEVSAIDPERALDGITLNGFYLTARSAGPGLALFAVLLSVLTAQSIAGEAERGQLRMLLPRPVNRSSIYLGKLGALLVVAVLAAGLDAVLSVLIGAATLGFSDVADVTLEGEQFGAARLSVDLALAYAKTALGVFGTASVALLMSALARQATTAITTTLLALAGSAGLAFVLGDPLARALFTTWDVRSFATLESLTAGTATYRDAADATLAWVVPLVTAAVTTVGGLAVFTRRDVTS